MIFVLSVCLSAEMMQQCKISSIFFVFKNQTQSWKRFECIFLAVRRSDTLKKKVLLNLLLYSGISSNYIALILNKLLYIALKYLHRNKSLYVFF